MRCRKARSLTSVFCSDELTGRQLTALREHLADCPGCKGEATAMRSVHEAGQALPGLSISDDFNRKLLDRVARERFAETRTKAYLPRSMPRFGWSRLVTATVAVGALALMAGSLSYFDGRSNQTVQFQRPPAGNALGDDDSYLTAFPQNNPNIAAPLARNWSLDQQFARSERLSRLTSSLLTRSGFGEMRLASTYRQNAVLPLAIAPYGNLYIRIRPVVREYRVLPSRSGGGSQGEY